MCNDYRLLVDAASIAEDFSDLKITIRFSEGVPNLEAREDIRITDLGVDRQDDRRRARRRRLGAAALELARPERAAGLQLPLRRPEFPSNRCLIVADGFYEFTDPKDPTKKRKDKWLFTRRGEPIFCIAGIWRETQGVGEAFTMLTMAPGPDIAPITTGRSSSLIGTLGTAGSTLRRRPHR